MSHNQNITNSLFSAVSEGKLETVRMLINSHGLCYSKVWLEGYALLCDALKNKHKEVAKLLLVSGSKVNKTTYEPFDTPLHFAIINCDIEIVKMLLEKGANVNAKNQYGRTPLYTAIEYKKIEVTELLLAYNVDINDKDNCDISPLQFAVMTGCLQIIKYLLNYGANVNLVCTSTWKKYYTPLHFAAEYSNKEVIMLLLNEGANVNAIGENSITPLHIASKYGNEDAVVLFLNSGADINAKTNDNLTPFHIVIKKEHKSVGKLLLLQEAKVDNQNIDDQTILNLAIKRGSLMIVKYILNSCPNINNKCNGSSLKTAVHGYGEQYKMIVEALVEYGFCINPADANDSQLLHAAIENGYLKIVEDLLKYGANVNSISCEGFTPLHTAVKNKKEELAKLLISHGADINAQDKTEKTPIFYATKNADVQITKFLLTKRANIKKYPEILNNAIKNDCLEIVEALMQYDVDINAVDEYGRTALHFTVSRNIKDNLQCLTYENPYIIIRGEIAKLLLNNGAYVDAQTKSGITTLHAAARKGYVKIVESLLQHNANIKAVDEYGRTALHFTVLGETKESFTFFINDPETHINEDIAKLLLSKGAYVDAQTRNGLTTLHIATQKGYVKIVQLLLQHCANINLCDRNGKTALHFVVMNESEDFFGYLFINHLNIDVKAEIAKMLLSKGANVDAKTKNGVTALHVAVKKGYTKIVEILLKHNANYNSRLENSMTPLHLAVTEGSEDIIKIILKFGADINSRDEYGRTPLHIATEKRLIEIVKILLEYGSDINITNINNITPFDFAMERIKSNTRANHISYYNYYEYLERDSCLSERIIQIFKCHIIKLKTANLYVNEQNLQYIRSDEMNDFKGECQKEIRSAMSEQFNNTNISIYDILVKNINFIAACMRNENIMQTLKSGSYESKFPIYASIIKYNFIKGTYKRRLLEKGDQIFNFLSKTFSKLPHYCTEQILSYLNEEDIKNLINTFPSIGESV